MRMLLVLELQCGVPQHMFCGHPCFTPSGQVVYGNGRLRYVGERWAAGGYEPATMTVNSKTGMCRVSKPGAFFGYRCTIAVSHDGRRVAAIPWGEVRHTNVVVFMGPKKQTVDLTEAFSFISNGIVGVRHRSAFYQDGIILEGGILSRSGFRPINTGILANQIHTYWLGSGGGKFLLRAEVMISLEAKYLTIIVWNPTLNIIQNLSLYTEGELISGVISPCGDWGAVQKKTERGYSWHLVCLDPTRTDAWNDTPILPPRQDDSLTVDGLVKLPSAPYMGEEKFLVFGHRIVHTGPQRQSHPYPFVATFEHRAPKPSKMQRLADWWRDHTGVRLNMGSGQLMNPVFDGNGVVYLTFVSD